MGASPEAQISKTKPGPTHSRIIRAIYIFLGEPKAHGNSGRKTFPGKSIHTEISPLRFASVEMTKGRVVMDRSKGLGDGEPQVPPLRSPVFPVETRGVRDLHAALSTESCTCGRR